MKLLIVDDNKSISDMLSKFFTVKGHKCIVKNHGRDVVSLLKQEHFDAVILDLAMPDIGGSEIIDELIKENILEQQKIIVLTASSVSDFDINELKTKGAFECLKKPAPLDTIQNVLAKIGGS